MTKSVSKDEKMKAQVAKVIVLQQMIKEQSIVNSILKVSSLVDKKK